MCRRIEAVTADSFKLNWASIASSSVRSAHAIFAMRDRLASQRNSFDALIRGALSLYVVADIKLTIVDASHYTHLLPISFACVTLRQICLKIEQIFPIWIVFRHLRRDKPLAFLY